MSILNNLKISLFLSLAIAFGLVGPVFAAEPTLQDTPVTIDKSALELGNVKDNDKLSPEDKLAKEIEARTKIVTEAIFLSQKEIGGLKDKLNQLPKFKHQSPEKELQDGYLSSLDDNAAYFDDQSKKLDDLKPETDQNKLNGELKGLAKELKDYRDNEYNATVSKIVEFTLLFYDEHAVGTAKTRLGKVNADIKKLEKLSLINKGIFKNQLDKATKLIDSAGDLQLQAKDLVLNPQLDTGEATTTNQATTTKKVLAPQPKPKDLIEKSLTNIKSAYDIFLKISRDTRKILGID